MNRLLFFIGVLSGVCFTHVCEAEVDLDFLAGRLNGVELSSLTVDSVTDLLGRPSKSDSLGGQAILVYENLGIKFISAVNSEGIGSIEIYLTRITDDYTSIGRGIEVFSAFQGKLPKGLNGNWKLEKFLKEFKEEGAVDTSDYDHIAQSRKLGMNPENGCTAEIRGPKYRVVILYDDRTKFLNKVRIVKK